ncbi:MAG: amidohydrolase family protein [Clostridia bacterium]|nr:amidohydrolase family protein [Clostridia bacterium]
MADYLKIPFNGIKNPFDGHIHIFRWYDTERNIDFLHGLEEYRKECGLKYIALAPLPAGKGRERDVGNNIICAFYKLANKNTYSYGGILYPTYPVKSEDLAEMTLARQHDELMEIGFDGIKMLEGKPNLYRCIGNSLDSDFYEELFRIAEGNGTYILMHASDPSVFWDEAKATPENLAKGWCYSDSSYPGYEEIYEQIENVLSRHPRLNLCLAHFFFLSPNPEKLAKLLDTYPNLTVDITPGGEMYIDFNANPKYFYDFFVKYQDRIIFGTDMAFPVNLEAGKWLCDREYRFFNESTSLMSFDDNVITGIKIPSECNQKIFSDNLLSKLGAKPKEINKKALKAYIEKYRHLIQDKKLLARIDELSIQYL